jgi:glycine/D-amino acid oxidase-like deaminating enzyme
LAKGEVITIKFEDKDFSDKIEEYKAVISKGIFVLPLGNSLFRVGANYEWEFTHDRPSEVGLEFLQSGLRELFGDKTHTIVDHRSGIRPTVADRRPFQGKHPIYERAVIFNGMGSKGVMLAPYFTEHLLDHLYGGKELMHEVDIKRFPKRFRNLSVSLDVQSAWF